MMLHTPSAVNSWLGSMLYPPYFRATVFAIVMDSIYAIAATVTAEGMRPKACRASMSVKMLRGAGSPCGMWPTGLIPAAVNASAKAHWSGVITTTRMRGPRLPRGF